MSQFASAAPRPPPPPPVKNGCSITNESNGNEVVIKAANDLNECKWAAEYPELQKGCFLSRVCQYAQPKECQYFCIPSLLQVILISCVHVFLPYILCNFVGWSHLWINSSEHAAKWTTDCSRFACGRRSPKIYHKWRNVQCAIFI